MLATIIYQLQISDDDTIPLNFVARYTLIIGRGQAAGYQPDVDLTHYTAIRQHGVSRRHAAFMLNEGGLYLVDLDSLNGTKINGKRLIPNQLNPVRSGDVIQLGYLRLYVRQTP